MFTKTSEIESMLDAEIRATLAVMEGLEKTDEKYGKLLEHVAKLHKLKGDEKPQPKINPDNALLVAANLAGILAILGHEHVGPISSKAISFVFKPR